MKAKLKELTSRSNGWGYAKRKQKLEEYIKGAFTQLKLQHIQFNVVNADTLREAQQRPQDYAGLVVRVAGYSAFFVELSKEIQDDIIRRTAHQL